MSLKRSTAGSLITALRWYRLANGAESSIVNRRARVCVNGCHCSRSLNFRRSLRGMRTHRGRAVHILVRGSIVRLLHGLTRGCRLTHLRRRTRCCCYTCCWYWWQITWRCRFTNQRCDSVHALTGHSQHLGGLRCLQVAKHSYKHARYTAHSTSEPIVKQCNFSTTYTNTPGMQHTSHLGTNSETVQLQYNVHKHVRYRWLPVSTTPLST